MLKASFIWLMRSRGRYWAHTVCRAQCQGQSSWTHKSGQTEWVPSFTERNPCAAREPLRSSERLSSPPTEACPQILGWSLRPQFTLVMSGTTVGTFVAEFSFHFRTEIFSLRKRRFWTDEIVPMRNERNTSEWNKTKETETPYVQSRFPVRCMQLWASMTHILWAEGSKGAA